MDPTQHSEIHEVGDGDEDVDIDRSSLTAPLMVMGGDADDLEMLRKLKAYQPYVFIKDTLLARKIRRGRLLFFNFS
jgi:hypothetical protein